MRLPALPAPLWALLIASFIIAGVLSIGVSQWERQKEKNKDAWPRTTISSPLTKIENAAIAGNWVAQSAPYRFSLTITGNIFQLIITDTRKSTMHRYARGEINMNNGVLQMRLKNGLGRPRDTRYAYETYFPLSFVGLEFAITELSSQLMTTQQAQKTMNALTADLIDVPADFLRAPLIWQRQN